MSNVVSMVNHIDEKVMADVRALVRKRISANLASEIIFTIAGIAGGSWEECITDFACQAADEEFTAIVCDEIYRMLVDEPCPAA